MPRHTNLQAAQTTADLARLSGNKPALDMALSAVMDFDFAVHADARGERSRAWAKRSSGRRFLEKARALLQPQPTT